jgi:hypothetical protein
MKYGICTSHTSSTKIGSIYILDSMEGDVYYVLEGNCDCIRKDAITLISEAEYTIMRTAHNAILANLSSLDATSQEYYSELYALRNKLDKT